MEWLYRFAIGFKRIKALAVEYGANSSEAEALAKRIGSVLGKVPLYLTAANPVIGTHTGPNILIVSVLAEE